MLSIRIVAAIVGAHILPGLLLTRWFGAGRGALERWVVAAVMGGPLAALIYWMSLLAGSDALYWTVLGLVDLAAIAIAVRDRARKTKTDTGCSREILAGLILVLLLVEGAYFVTTGHLYRVDADGHFVMDRALQRDTLFHVGFVRALTSSYPPELLSMAGAVAKYHDGYHLQLAAWSRFFGIDAFDGVYRVAAGWSLALLVLSAFMLGRRFMNHDGAALVVTVFIFGSGLGYLFFSAPGGGWWSLIFMDAALVSIFLPNPLLPALPLLLVGLACLADYLSAPRVGRLAAAALCLTSIWAIKVFLGAQVLAGTVLAVVVSKRDKRGRLLKAAMALLLFSTPFLWRTLAASQGGNTSVIVRPLEIVRYSMELLGWSDGVDSLMRVGGASDDPAGFSDWARALGATLLWTLGFLGLRLLGLRAFFRDWNPVREPLHRVMAFIVAVGFPATLLLRIAPADASGPSRLEGINDAFWFATQSGFVLWFWTAEALLALKKNGRVWPVAVAGGALALPCTVQHFVVKHAMDVDRVPAPVVKAAEQVRRFSASGDAWVEPPDRAHPSPIAYLAGRPVVHDGYVGYEYMFVPLREREIRRHAVAQFWRSEDAAFGDWFLDHYDVKGLWATESWPAPQQLLERVVCVYANDSVRLYRIESGSRYAGPIATPTRLPMGMAGEPYFGTGWARPSGHPRRRRLEPGKAYLYLPREQNVPLVLRLRVQTPHAPGEIRSGASTIMLERMDGEAVVGIGEESGGRGLKRLTIHWTGDRGLVVERIDVATPPRRNP